MLQIALFLLSMKYHAGKRDFTFHFHWQSDFVWSIMHKEKLQASSFHRRGIRADDTFRFQQCKLPITEIAIRVDLLYVEERLAVRSKLRSLNAERWVAAFARTHRRRSLPPLPYRSLHDTSVWSCQAVSPHPQLIGAQRSNQGRTNRTVLVISCDQCCLGSGATLARSCHHARAFAVTRPICALTRERPHGLAYTDQVASHWPPLLWDTQTLNERKQARLVAVCVLLLWNPVMSF